MFTYAECRLTGLIAFLPRVITSVPMDLLWIDCDSIPGRLAFYTSHEQIVSLSGREKRENSILFSAVACIRVPL